VCDLCVKMTALSQSNFYSTLCYYHNTYIYSLYANGSSRNALNKAVAFGGHRQTVPEALGQTQFHNRNIDILFTLPIESRDELFEVETEGIGSVRKGPGELDLEGRGGDGNIWDRRDSDFSPLDFSSDFTP